MTLMYQDAAGAIPAILPGQPVGLVRHAAGTVDAIQPTALSRPTLARWPKGGRFNLLNSLTEVPTVGSVWGVIGGTMVDGILTENTASSAHNTFALGSNNEWSPNIPIGSRVYLSMWVKAVGDTTVAQLAFGASYFGSGSFANFDLVTGAVNATGCNASMVPEDDGWRLKADAVTTVSSASGAPYALCLANNNMAAGRVPSYLGSGRQLQWGKAQVALSDRPYQNVITQYDITEAGKPDVWHLSNDGGDSLGVTLPAGTYGRAWVDAYGVVTVDSVVNPTGALIPTAANATQADVILRQGAFTAAEEAAIREYWAQEIGP